MIIKKEEDSFSHSILRFLVEIQICVVVFTHETKTNLAISSQKGNNEASIAVENKSHQGDAMHISQMHSS